MELIKKYDDLPDSIKNKLKKGNIHFSKEYNNYIKATGAQLWYLLDDNYILPVSITEKIKIKQAMYVSEPFQLNNSNEIKHQVNFLNMASVILKKQGVSWIYTSAAALFDVYPEKSLRIPFGSHVIDLSLTEEELLMKMHSKHRNSVRRAEKTGVIIKSGGKELINDYLKADAETWERSKRNSYGKDFFDRIIDNLNNNVLFYIAYKNNEPQSGACYFFNSKMSYYMYGASITNPEPGSTNLLQWQAIKDMKKAGVERFSFVGCRINEDENSKYHGIQRFKERFGGELQQGYMFKVILCPFKYKFFKFAYFIKNRKKLVDAIDQEIRKWKELQIHDMAN